MNTNTEAVKRELVTNATLDELQEAAHTSGRIARAMMAAGATKSEADAAFDDSYIRQLKGENLTPQEWQLINPEAYAKHIAEVVETATEAQGAETMTREQMRDKVSANITAIKEAQNKSERAAEIEKAKANAAQRRAAGQEVEAQWFDEEVKRIQNLLPTTKQLLNDLGNLAEFAKQGALNQGCHATALELDEAADRIKEALCK